MELIWTHYFFSPIGEKETIRKYFASSYLNVNRADESGNTALMVAAIHGMSQLIPHKQPMTF